MTAQISIFGIFCIIVVLFIFRSTIRSITKTLPKTTDRIIQHLDKTVTVNLIEEDLELNKRLQEIESDIPTNTVDADEIWNRLHGKEKKPVSRSNNRRTQAQENK